mgnify:CR=1 FL=1
MAELIQPPLGLIDLAYPFLKQQGLTYLQQLAGKIWTDYNEHDPGVTILEVLCFAIIDLEYRTNFYMEDLLAPSPNEHPSAVCKQFYEAQEILPCNPLTANDFLKLIVDVAGVKNAKLWFGHEPQTIQGGYQVFIDLEERIIKNAQEKIVLEKVKKTLYQHRNLCEDFFSIQALKPLYLQIHAALEVDEAITQEQGEMLIAEILFSLQSFIAPYIKFYSLKDMILHRRKSVEEIFTGPLLTQGFVDEKELERSKICSQIYSSELLKKVTSIQQVKSVTQFAVSLAQQQKAANTLFIAVPLDCVPKLDLAQSAITLYQKGSLILVNPNKVKQWYDELVHARTFKRAYVTEEEIAIPKGRYRNLAAYTSIQNDFPLIFGVGQEGLAGSASPERKAQANQLKGYLMFFDQVFANSLAQLAHVKDLMAVQNKANKGYFTQLPQKVPQGNTLIKQPNLLAAKDLDAAFKVQRKYLGVALPKPKQYQAQAVPEETYLAYLNKILTAHTGYTNPKNNMLDHLLARFSETFAERSRHLYAPSHQENLQNIRYDKAMFLQDYIAISRDRNKGIDITNAQNYGWNSDNISGFERRLCRSLGIKNLKRRFLYEMLKDNFYLEKGFEQQSFELFLGENLQSKYDNLLILKGNFPQIKELAILYGAQAAHYEIVERSDAQYGIHLYVDQKKQKFIEFISKRLALTSYEHAQAIVKQAIGFFKTFNRESEGFHLIEHILLRTNTVLQGANDPYSFRMTLVFPAWPARFQRQDFKHFLHELILLESPAHVFVNVVWLDLVEMETFEKAYKEWTHYRTTLEEADPRLKQASRHLLGLLMLYSQEEE